MSAARVFAYETARVRVEVDDEAHVDWLAECVTPHFEVEAPEAEGRCRPEGEARCRPEAEGRCRPDGEARRGPGGDAPIAVALRQDPAGYAALRARGPAPGGGEVVCFAMDGRVVQHPRWSAPTGVTVYDEEFRVFYVAGRGRLEVVADRPPQPWSRVALLRVVREVVAAECHRAGRLTIHAAAFAAHGRGAMLVGAKRAGKTSLLAHALAHPAVRFLGNDRAVVADGEAPTVRGMPTIVRVRPEMAALFPEIFRDCSRDPDQACWSRAEALARPHRERPADAPVVLTPPQFVALFAAAQAAVSPLRTVAFPQVDAAATGLAIRALPVDEAGARLHAALFPAPPSTGLMGAVVDAPSGRPVAMEALARRCQRLAERVRCVEVRLGPDAYSTDPGARRLVEGLLG